MTLRAMLLSGISRRGLHAALPPLTARQLADVFAHAYRSLGLRHLDKPGF